MISSSISGRDCLGARNSAGTRKIALAVGRPRLRAGAATTSTGAARRQYADVRNRPSKRLLPPPPPGRQPEPGDRWTSRPSTRPTPSSATWSPGFRPTPDCGLAHDRSTIRNFTVVVDNLATAGRPSGHLRIPSGRRFPGPQERGGLSIDPRAPPLRQLRRCRCCARRPRRGAPLRHAETAHS